MVTDDFSNQKSIPKQLKAINFVQTFFGRMPSAKSKIRKWKPAVALENNAMAATKHAKCARDHRPEPMDIISKVSWTEI